jgi:uracil-DNA glycosylase
MNYNQLDFSKLISKYWFDLIRKDLLKEVEQNLNNEIQKNLENEFYPYKQDDIFKIFKICSLKDIKVVILGQDPYYASKNQANGIAFSVNNGEKLPPSLKNIYKEAKINTKNGDLTNWVKQGVFLLNASLTVQANCPNSHQKIWNKFIPHIIDLINKENEGVVFVSWGNSALEKYKCINLEKHIVLSTSHPSPLSCYKTDNPFMGSDIFIKINKKLKDLNKEEINWIIN